ncbi:MAG: intradiol ring-cleavage dioxygenase [Acidobacteriota bacterium]|nr:intradiol ring-cleavage dioxygenase [Acidobacteriota bacterium]
MVSRRELLASSLGALSLTAFQSAFADCESYTAATGPGPFYPEEIPDTFDLTGGGSGKPVGETLFVFGRVQDEACRPIAGATVEIWQCDHKGHYKHERQRGVSLDPNFAYFGRVITNENGGYFFKTIMPAPYGNYGFRRPPHIHFMVRKKNYRSLTTEMQFAGSKFDKLREDDGVLASIPEAKRPALIIERKRPSDFPELAARFDEDGRCCDFKLTLRQT